MKSSFAVMLATLIASSGSPVTAQASPGTLVWSDEFDGSTINRDNWTFDIGGGGWGNKELQYYTDRPENARVEGGCLVIEARAERLRNRRYTSARLKTQGLQSFQYGRVEASIRIPYGQGIWPAFWMLGEDIGTIGWPACGEIDIMENIGREPATVHGTVHGPGYSGADSVGGAANLDSGAFSDQFHRYAIEWEPMEIRWYVDDTHYFTVTPGDLPGPWVFDHPFFIILNVAVGGYWPGAPDSTTVFPQQMLVDYVHVYQNSAPPPPPPGTTIHVADIAMGINTTGPLWQATAIVRVVDERDAPVAGVTVTGSWSGLVSGGNTSFVTDAAGLAGPFYSQKTRASGTISFGVVGLSREGWSYDQGANIETSDSITR